MTIVYTIGYEGTDIDRFVATLKAVGVTVLADVRALALSRKRGFSKKSLKDRLASEGIAYRHFAELGDPKNGREAARNGRHGDFQRIYRDHLAADRPQASLAELNELVLSAPSCLLCFERDPSVCHRSIVAEKLRASGIEISDLYGDNPVRYVNYAEKFSRHRSREGAAAA